MNIPLLTVKEFIKNINQNDNPILLDNDESNAFKTKIGRLKTMLNKLQ